MKKSILVLFILIINFNIVLAQQYIFDKIKDNNIYSRRISEKIERLKLREDIKISEQVVLKPNITLSKNFKGIFNIFDKDLEFEITEDHGIDVNDIHGYKAELQEGGYAILSVSNHGIEVSIWYRDNFYRIEAIDNGIYFISEMDLDKIIEHDCNYDQAEKRIFNKTNNQSSVFSQLSPATMKVFVAYTPAVAQNYNVSNLINQCISTTNIAYGYSLVSSTIQLVGSAQLNYTESGSSETDVNRFKNNFDYFMDEIHSLRNQYEADICVLLINSSDANGRVPDGAIGAVFSNAFCVVKASAAAGYYSFAHEIGHLQGCRHDSDQGTTPYGFAHGYNWYGKMSYFPYEEHYRTIMSIIDKGYHRVQYFSNPNVYDQLNNPLGTEEYNYCASAIDDYASIIAGFEPYYTTSGTMNEDEWWSGNITVNGNVTVNSGVTLTIAPGTQIKFSTNTQLIVNGTLSAIGTSSNRITFTRKNSSGTWGGIRLNSGTGSNVQYCNIYYAANGIYAYNTSPTIKYNNIENNSTGVNCDYYSSPTMVGNNIRYNTSVGIYCSTSSSPNLTDNGTSGSNVIRNNGTNGGFYAQYNCVPDLDGYNSTGNSIFDNTGYELRAYYGCTIDATRVWWGSSDPAVVATYLYSNYSTINYLPILTSNPNPNRNIVPTESNDKIPIFTTASVQIDELELAKQYQREGKYNEAINLFEVVFKKETTTSRGRYSLIKLEQCFTQVNRKDFLDYSSTKLKPLVQEGNELFVLLLELETHQLYNMGYKDEAMNNLKTILDKYNMNEDIEKQTLYRIGVFYIDLYNDKVNAQKTFDDLAAKYPNDELLTYANLVLNEERYNIQGSKNANQEIATVVKEELTNYPNPFNPTTKISFTLATKDNIKLKVFDILGKEVVVLAHGEFEMGKHEIEFNASSLPSGVYFYNLTTSSNSSTKKMLLLK